MELFEGAWYVVALKCLLLFLAGAGLNTFYHFLKKSLFQSRKPKIDFDEV